MGCAVAFSAPYLMFKRCTYRGAPNFAFSGGRIVKVVVDLADDAYVDVEQHMTPALARG